MFDAIVFAITDLGFVARSAREEDDGGEFRLAKIQRIIEQCYTESTTYQPSHSTALIASHASTCHWNSDCFWVASGTEAIVSATKSR